ncbi:MAG TPA: T9SS type A sorting domain-containing protein [Bacteroidia bacterium]|nr:T9SS type A sorting domain-containing protein [Bacteroidia bacterium]
MKKSIRCFFFFLLLFNSSYSQPFGGNNAVWHYDLCWWWNQPIPCEPVILNSSPPDTINGISYYTISYDNPFWVCTPDTVFTVYESNDSVYYWLSTSSRYTMLYNWNAMPGDTEVVYGDTFIGVEDSAMIKIDSTSIININGFNKKIFYTSYAGGGNGLMFGGTIIEDIGSTSFLFPQSGSCDPFPDALRCYEDTIIGLYQPWNPGIECDTVIYLGEDELSFTSGISLFPNPANDFINIKYTQPAYQTLTIRLYSLYGQLLSFYKTDGKQEVKFSLKEYPAGIYFVKLNTGGKEVMSKVVKL